MNGLYLVTDSSIAHRAAPGRAGYSLRFVVEEACRAGVQWVQLREKKLSTRTFVELATTIRQITRQYGAKLIINDRVDVALAVDADGVHVGQDDMGVGQVRALIGPDRLIGLSVNSLAELETVTPDVDYLGVATIFPTGTKTDTTSLLGLHGLRVICGQTALPAFAIGGINQKNISQILPTGAAGAAVVSAICGAPSPYEAARELIRLLENQG